MNTATRSLLAVTAVVGLTVMAGCSTSNPLDPAASSGGSGSSGDVITVASQNFPENVILGEIYAQALEAAGYKVNRKLNIGSREVYYSQMESCSLSVVPEYNQALLSFIAPDVKVSGTEEVNAALTKALPKSLEVLKSSEAQDNNAVAVTKDTAKKNNLKSIEDLNAVSAGWVFGGPPEWADRADGMAGLTATYGTKFGEYRVLDYSGPITLSALDKGDVQSALLFSTVPQIASNGYVVLDDPKHVLGVNNVIPLICKDAVDDKARGILESIGDKLTTEELTKLNASYSLDKKDADVVAKEFLDAAGLN